jgi:hypothetical protein
MTPSISVEHQDKLQRAFQAAPAATQRALLEAMHDRTLWAQRELQEAYPRSTERPRHPKAKRTPGHTPHTADTITSQVIGMREGGVLGIVGSPSPIALFIEDGTKAHVIRARFAKALAWPLGMEAGAGFGGPVKSVRHPGTQPQKVFERFFGANQRTLGLAFEQAIDRVFTQLFGDGAGAPA